MTRSTEKSSQEKHDQDNRSDQLNPNNDAYWQSRGEEGRPEHWQDSAEGQERKG